LCAWSIIVGAGLAARAGTTTETPAWSGFRGDGSGHFRAHPPTRFPDGAHERWIAELPGQGASSPVAFGACVFVTWERHGVGCVDVSTGALTWQATVGEAPRDDPAALAEKRAESSQARRALRRGRSAAVEVRTVLRLQAELAALAEGDATPHPPGEIGHAAPTPAASPAGVFVLFGDGTAAHLTHAGTLVWKRALGPPPPTMNGYDRGTAASPVLAGDLLVVGHGALHGLDAATGATRWTLPGYLDFGTPVVVPGPAGARLVLPDGRVVEAATGEVRATSPASTWFAGPTRGAGSEVVFAGLCPRQLAPFRNALTLGRFDAGLDTKTPAPPRFVEADETYATALVSGDAAFVLERGGLLRRLSLAGGADSQQRLPLDATVYASPVEADGHLYVMDAAGTLAVVTATETPTLVSSWTLPVPCAQSWATPLPLDDALLVRCDERLHRFDRRDGTR